MIDRSFIEKIVELAQVELKEVNGYQYSTKPLHMITIPMPEALKATTLTSLVDYIKSMADMQTRDRSLIVHVVSPWEVELVSSLRGDAKRETFFSSAALVPSIPFGRFVPAEEFNIMMQSSFVDNEDKATILQVVGNIQEDNVANIADDGVTQAVVAKVGISTKANVVVPNPVILAPYRTFPEIEQPMSKFVFRMKQGALAALFEADGGAWKNEAMQRIKAWLEQEIHSVCNKNCEDDTECDGCNIPVDPYQNITIIA